MSKPSALRPVLGCAVVFAAAYAITDAGAATVTLVTPAPGEVVNQSQVDFQCHAEDLDGLVYAGLYLGTVESQETLVLSGTSRMTDAQLTAASVDQNLGEEMVINVDGENPHAHAILRFEDLVGSDANQIPPGAIILSATLEVNCVNLGNMMTAYRLLEDWQEDSVTWSERATDIAWSDPGADGTVSRDSVAYPADCTSAGLRSIDLTGMVQAWASGSPNYGLVLIDGGTDGVDFDSSEGAVPPVLTVVFTSVLGWGEVAQRTLSGETTADISFDDIAVNVDAEYIWNCLVTDGQANASWAEADAVFTVDLHVPDAPVRVGPPDGGLGVSQNPVLEVTVSDPDGDSLDVTFFGRSVDDAEPFTLVVLPDTQFYSQLYPQIFDDQTQWIVDTAEELNTVFVCHEGDVAQSYGTVEEEYINASNSMSRLDLVVPYAVLPGNHDRPTTLYNQYFPYTKYAGMYNEAYGHFSANQNDYNYYLLAAGGVNFVVLHMAYSPSAEAMAWANGVLTTHADRQAILVTHSFLNTDGSRTSEGQDLWTNLVVPNANLNLVLCGHNHAEYTHTDPVGERQVHQLLADYQSLPNGGDGYLRLMRFVPAEDTIYVATYSPRLGTYQTDANSQFSLEYPMSAGFEALGTVADVSSGATASLTWPDRPLDSDHAWYATVTDPSGRTRTGPVWTFHTTANDGTPPVIGDVAVSELTDSSARIVWTTDEPADSRVDYQASGEPLSSVSDPALDTEHDLSLDGLDANTTYSYGVSSRDGSGNPAVFQVETFTTLPVNHPPVADDQTVETDEDTTDVPIVLTATDVDSDPLTYWVADAPAHGTLRGTAPDLLFTPDADYYGEDTFTFAAGDGQLSSAPATVYITVNPVDDPPGVPQGLTALADSLLVALDWEDNSEPESDLAGYRIYRAEPADSGIYVRIAETVESGYEDAAVEEGVTYGYAVTAVDNAGLESDLSAGVEATFSDTRYDAYVEEEPVVILGTVEGSHTGTLDAGDGSEQRIVEAPNGRAGMVSLEAQYLLHTLADADAATSLILHLNAEWTAGDPTDNLLVYIWNVDFGWEDITPILHVGSWVAVSPADYILADRTLAVLFTDSEAVRKEFRDGLTVDLLSAHITADPVQNRVPVAVDDAAQTTEDVTVVINVLANDHDPDGDPLAVDTVVSPAQQGGTVAFDSASDGVVYTPPPGFTGTDSFDYTVGDGQGGTAGATVTVVVAPAGQNPPCWVSDLLLNVSRAGKNWRASADITVESGINADPVPNATVTADWYLNNTLLVGGALGVTDAAGRVVMVSSPVKAKSKSVFRIEITDVAVTGYAYDPAGSLTSGLIEVP